MPGHPALLTRTRVIDGLFVEEKAPALAGGPATPLLFVHGSQHGAWAWETWLGLFAAMGWRAFALSLRNHTGSYSVPEPRFLDLRTADYGADVLAVMRALDGPPVVIGHSMGGLVAQKAAEAAPVAGLVLVCSVGPGQLGRIRAPLPPDRPIHYSPEQVRSLWFTDIDDDTLAAFHTRLVPESPGVVNDYSGTTVTVDRSRIACPVLVIGGERDATPVHPAAAIAAFYDAPALVVPGAPHNLMMGRWALPVAMRLNQWLLAEIDGPSIPAPAASR
jgi:pimeloyl-ACP methyl ester carboxylesterase